MNMAIIEVVTLRTLAFRRAQAPRLETLTVSLLALGLLTATRHGSYQREDQVLLRINARGTIHLTEGHIRLHDLIAAADRSDRHFTLSVPEDIFAGDAAAGRPTEFCILQTLAVQLQALRLFTLAAFFLV
jgi:hypothetical protein